MRSLLIMLACLLAEPVSAAHITDKMAVGLYAGANDEEPEQLLISGTPVEILDRGSRLCKVRTGNGDEGWLECRYVSDEKPARSMLVEAQARNAELNRQMREFKEKARHAGEQVQLLQRRLKAAEQLLEQTPEATPPELPEPRPPVQAKSSVEAAPTAGWLSLDPVSMLIGLLGGLALGGGLFYVRCRRRFGGLKI